MNKLKSRRGETLTETLVAVLIIALSAAILAVMTATSARISGRTHQADAQFYGELSAAELGRGRVPGEVTISVPGGGSQRMDVWVTGGDGALTSYRAVGP